MDVVGILQRGELGRDRSEEVVDRDGVLCHKGGGGGVALDDGGGGLLFRGIVRDRRGAGPDECRAGGGEAREDLREAGGVVGERSSAIVDTEVEVDHVPFSGAGGGEPGFQFLEAVGGGAAVFGGAVDIGFAGEGGADGERVAARDGVADEEDAREGGIVGDEVPCGGGAFDEIAFVDREVETVAEVCLENGFPRLARGRQRGEFLLVEAVDALVFGRFFRGGFGGVGGLGGGERGSERERQGEEGGEEEGAEGGFHGERVES